MGKHNTSHDKTSEIKRKELASLLLFNAVLQRGLTLLPATKQFKKRKGGK